MATGIQLSTAGVRMYYAKETTAGERPTAVDAYKEVTDELKSIPELNPEPDNLETTTLAETEWKTYIPGLKDPGGALGFTINLTEKSMGEWAAMVDDYNTGAADGLHLWYAIIVPGLTKGLYFTGHPSSLGMPAIEVSAVLEATAYITPTNAPAWLPKPGATAGE